MEAIAYYDEIEELVKDLDDDTINKFNSDFHLLIVKYKKNKVSSTEEKMKRFKSLFGANRNDLFTSDELIKEIDSLTKDNDDELLKLLGINE